MQRTLLVFCGRSPCPSTSLMSGAAASSGGLSGSKPYRYWYVPVCPIHEECSAAAWRKAQVWSWDGEELVIAAGDPACVVGVGGLASATVVVSLVADWGVHH